MSTFSSWSQGGLTGFPVTDLTGQKTSSSSDGDATASSTPTPQQTSTNTTSDTSSTSTTSDTEHSAGTPQGQQPSEQTHEKDPDSHDRQASVGAIAGGTVAFVILLITIAVAIWIARRRRQRQSRGKHPALSLSPSFEEEAIVSSQIEPFLVPNSSGTLEQSFLDEKAANPIGHGSSATGGLSADAQQVRVPVQRVSNTTASEPSSIQREMSEIRAEIERLRRVALRPGLNGGESTDGHDVATSVSPPAYEE